MTVEVDPIILRAFLNESSESINQLETDLQALEHDYTNMELVNSIFRALHTIKGNSSFLDLSSITEVTHEAESILDRIRHGDDSLNQETIDVLFSVVDILRSMVADPSAKHSVSDVVAQLVNYSKSNRPITEFKSAESPDKKSEEASEARDTRIALPTIRIEESKLERMVNLVNELKIVRHSLETLPEMLADAGEELRELRFSLDMAVSRVSRITSELGSLIYGARLVPVDNVFRKFPRVIRDLSQKLGKEIRLEIKNGSAELDKSIVEAIADPMTHLIRNAADHGIESPRERADRGKEAVGKVILDSYVDMNSVVIEITDDGRGIDTDIVAQKAVERKIISADKALTMTYADKLALIFAPGFSTAEVVTDISGRGVGMDVVKSNINRLKGTVQILSEVGRGTKIQLRFPLSIVVIRCLYVYAEEICYAIPLHQVAESLQIGEGQLYTQRPRAKEKYDIFPIYALKDLLWDRFQLPPDTKQLSALKVKGRDGNYYGLLVDRFSFMEEAIVHSVDSYISSIPGIQGGVIRKDGTVSVSINLEGLYDRIANRKPLAWAMVPVWETKAELGAMTLPSSLEELLANSGLKVS